MEESIARVQETLGVELRAVYRAGVDHALREMEARFAAMRAEIAQRSQAWDREKSEILSAIAALQQHAHANPQSMSRERRDMMIATAGGNGNNTAGIASPFAPTSSASPSPQLLLSSELRMHSDSFSGADHHPVLPHHTLQRPVARRAAGGLSSIVKVNVGGQVFHSRRSTLCSIPGSFLEALFSGRHEEEVDEAGCIFIDRDPQYFGIILNWLRDPSSPRSLPLKDTAFLHELAFYGLEDVLLGDTREEEETQAKAPPCLYVVGASSPAERYNPERNVWDPLAEMQERRSGAAYCWLHSKLYALGGCDRTMSFNSVERYDPKRNLWVPLEPMHMRRHSMGVAVLGGKLYVVAGLDHDTPLGSAERYDPATRTWELLPGLRACRGKAACAVLNTRLYVLGGCDRGDDGTSSPLNAVERFNEERRCWEPVCAMGQARYDFAAAVMQGKLYAVGGLASSSTQSVLASVECYDPQRDAWEGVAAMTERRFALACCASIHNQLYAAGGSNPCALETVERYDLATDTWELLPPMHQPRHFFTAAVFQNRLFIVGGMWYRRDKRSQRVGGSTLVNTVEVYDPEDGSWASLPTTNSPRSGGTCVVST